jgi:hypothetical protein
MTIKREELSPKMLGGRSLPPKQLQRRGRGEVERGRVMVEYERFRGKRVEKGGRQGGRTSMKAAILRGWRGAIFCSHSQEVRTRIRETVLRMISSSIHPLAYFWCSKR